MTQIFDRTAEDVGNIVHLEHINLAVPDQLMATRFYVSALGLTRDPHFNTGVEVRWVNAGTTQFHLPSRGVQRLRGVVDLVLPGRQELVKRLHAVAPHFAGTEFAFHEYADFVEVTCPWGNRYRCLEPDPSRFRGLKLGIAQIELDVPVGCAAGIARFYQGIFDAPAELVGGVNEVVSARVRIGKGQQLLFTETERPLQTYDGHHIQIYVADFSGPHRRLSALGLVTEESSQFQFRFQSLVDPQTGQTCYELEHEVRSMTHPMFARPLVNRDLQQSSRNLRA